MLANVRALLSKHFSQHVMLYFIIILSFCVGIATGVFSVKALNETQKGQLLDYLVSSLKAVTSKSGVNYSQILWDSIFSNLKTTLLIWGFSIAIFAFPLVFGVMGIRGFILGFTVGFLIENMGLKGALFAVVAILPQNLIIIPTLVILTALSVNYSLTAFKNRKSKYAKKERTKLFLAYSVLSSILFLVIVLGSLIEAYLSPVLIKGVSGYIFG